MTRRVVTVPRRPAVARSQGSEFRGLGSGVKGQKPAQPYDDPTLSEREQQLVEWVNTARADIGADALAVDAKLMVAARKHAEHLATKQHLCEPVDVPTGWRFVPFEGDYPDVKAQAKLGNWPVVRIGTGSYTHPSGRSFTTIVLANPEKERVAPNVEAERALLTSYHSSSVEVVIGTESRTCFSGTIVEVSPTRARVLSCAHGLKEKGEIRVHQFWPPKVYRNAKVVARDDAADLSILEFDHPPEDKLIPTFVARADHELRVGDSATVIGKGRDPMEQVSTIMSVNRYLGKPTIEVVGTHEPGRSGGGLFQAGRQIGVVTGTNQEDGRKLATGLAAVRTLLLSLPRIGAIDTETTRVTLARTIEPADVHEMLPPDKP